MKRSLLIFPVLVFVLILAGCSGASPQELYATMTAMAAPTPPPGAIDIAATMVMQQMYAEATQQAANLQAEAVEAQFTATSQALQATQAVQTAEASATNQARAERTAWASTQSYQATEGAARATEFAWTQTVWNATVVSGQARATQAMAYTQAVLPAHQSEEITGLQAQETAQMGQAAQVDLAVQRQQIRNRADATLPWILLVACLVVGALLVIRAMRVRVEKNNRGDPTLVIIDDRIVQPDRMFGPVLEMGKNEVKAPLLAETVDLQADTTRRAQAIQVVAALPPGRDRQANSMAGMVFGQGGNGVVRVESPAQLGPVLDEAEERLLEDNHD